MGIQTTVERNQATVVEKNVELYLHMWNEIVNLGDFDIMDTHFAPDYVFMGVSGSLSGPAAAKQYMKALIGAFSDVEFIIEDAFGQGDKLVKRWVFQGTHSSELNGIPATGKRVTIEGVTVARMLDGKLVEERDFYNELSLLQQLGVAPPSEG